MNHSKEPGNQFNSEELLPVVYRELRQLAKVRLAQELPGQTLTPTALVHETYLRLGLPDRRGKWDSKGHFFGAAAEAMRRILIDNARHKMSQRRGGGRSRVDFASAKPGLAMTTGKARAILELDDCLQQFAVDNPREAELVKLRFFAGLTMEEAAEALGVTRRTAQRYWVFAKAALSRLMNQDDESRSATA